MHDAKTNSTPLATHWGYSFREESPEPTAEHQRTTEHETTLEPVAEAPETGFETTRELEEPIVEEELERTASGPLDEQTHTTAIDSEPAPIIESEEAIVPAKQPPADDEETRRASAGEESPEMAEETGQVEESHESAATEPEQPIDLNSHEQAQAHDGSDPETTDPEPTIDLSASTPPIQGEPAATEAESISKSIELLRKSTSIPRQKMIRQLSKRQNRH